MNDEKWQEIVDLAKKNFKDVELVTEDLVIETQDGPESRGSQDVLVFTSPAGTFKLVRENHPLVLEKKEHFSHRAGDTARTEYKIAEGQFTHKLRVFKEVGFEDWDEVTLDKLGL